jgi:peptide/nickel transport system permease protein
MRTSLPVVLAKRLAALVATVVLAPTIAYTLFHGLSGDLAESPPVAAWHYLVTTFWHFDLGDSSAYRQPVAEVLRWSFPVDVAMVVGGIAAGIAIGLAGGLVLAARPGSRVAAALNTATAFLLACPPYWLGFMVLILFAPGTGYVVELPFLSGALGYGSLPHTLPGWVQALWLPWVLVGLPLAAQVLRMTAATVREAWGEDFLRTARAKGLREGRILRRHALPLAAAPVAALTWANMAIVITNVTLMESAFNIPGIFREVRQIGSFADFPLLQGMIIETTFLIVVANMLADAVQARLDPTVR